MLLGNHQQEQIMSNRLRRLNLRYCFPAALVILVIFGILLAPSAGTPDRIFIIAWFACVTAGILMTRGRGFRRVVLTRVVSVIASTTPRRFEFASQRSRLGRPDLNSRL